MQKLSRISSGKNNNSCGIFHQDPNKIGFEIFWFLYDVSRNLQEIAKALLLFELPFRSEALGKNFCFAMWPLGRRQRWSGGDSGRGSLDSGRGRAGEDLRLT
jgi:hypothetical protein